MSGDLILDTGGWLLALTGEDEYARVLDAATTLYVPPLVLAEVGYHLRHRRGAMWRLLGEISHAPYVVETLTLEDLRRAEEIDRKFSDVGLGLTDASIVCLAERLGCHRVLSTDSDLAVVRFGPGWNQVLDLPVPPIRQRKERRRRPRR